jgi:hypothetical protein
MDPPRTPARPHWVIPASPVPWGRLALRPHDESPSSELRDSFGQGRPITLFIAQMGAGQPASMVFSGRCPVAAVCPPSRTSSCSTSFPVLRTGAGHWIPAPDQWRDGGGSWAQQNLRSASEAIRPAPAQLRVLSCSRGAWKCRPLCCANNPSSIVSFCEEMLGDGTPSHALTQPSQVIVCVCPRCPSRPCSHSSGSLS